MSQRYVDLLFGFDALNDTPTRALVKVCHPLLTQYLDAMRESDCEDGLIVGCRAPIKVVHQLG